DVIRNKKMATVPKCQLDVEFSGGTFVNEGGVIDGNLVSGRGWQDQYLYMPVFMKNLKEYQARRTAGS
ncbi:MAG: peptidase, partial [Solibacterales bacterium]|nr:peptidase [Bryobacterales bacterium]